MIIGANLIFGVEVGESMLMKSRAISSISELVTLVKNPSNAVSKSDARISRAVQWSARRCVCIVLFRRLKPMVAFRKEILALVVEPGRACQSRLVKQSGSPTWGSFRHCLISVMILSQCLV